MFLEYSSFYLFLSTNLTLVLNKLERVTEDSEPGLAPGPVSDELVAEPIATFTAAYLI